MPASPVPPAPAVVASPVAVAEKEHISPSARLYTIEGMHPLATEAYDDELLAPVTKFAQRWLFEHQNPSDCSGKKFAFSLGHGHGNGIGSHMHVIGTHFAAAVEKGYIFTFGPKAGFEWTDPETCPGGANWECFFRPPTNCSRSLMTPDNTIELGLQYEIADKLGIHASWVPGPLYRRIRAEFPHMTFHQVKYWWRAQGVAYLMRLNEVTVAALRKMRDPVGGVGLSVLGPDYSNSKYTAPSKLLETVRTTFPFPSGFISAHVRHGDKHTEMQLQPTRRYFEAAQQNFVVNAPFAVRRAMFVSTEDDRVLAEAEEYKGDWVVAYSRIPRANTGPVHQVIELGQNRAGQTIRTHLLQLLMALECDAWVTTRGSNWNRLIDELRCIWVPKCRNAVVDVGTPESWADYNW